MQRDDSPYRRGNRYEVLPIPMVAEHCHAVAAGAVQLVVESRALTNAILHEAFPDPERGDRPDEVQFDDHGASLHVVGTEDGLEHLRFDCFEHEPHYHYIEHVTGTNVVVRIDDVAVGDPVAFTLRCVGERLPEMLESTGQPALAAQVRSDMPKVREALAELSDLMARAR